MDSYGTNLGEKFAAKALERFFETTVVDKITNKNYEAMVSVGGTDRVSVKTYGKLTLNTFTGANETVQSLEESEGQLLLNHKKDYYFKIPSLEKFEDYVNNPESGIIAEAGKLIQEDADAFVLGLYADAGSGNRVGTDYTTGDITITITTGACVGNGTTWTSGMSGLGIKATGHSKWYRFTYVSATTGFVYEDSDDDTASYGGGTITSAAYTIEAATVLTVTADNIYGYIDALATKLDENKIPRSDRWLVVNAKIASKLRQSDELSPAIESAYQDVIKKGLIGTVAGFQVYQNEQVYGNNTTGYYIMAGHISAITYAVSYKESDIEPLIANFGKAYKSLVVSGAKILDERRKALCYLWAKV